MTDYLEEYYLTHDEDSRLLSRRGQVEYRTTRKYILDCLQCCAGKAVLEIGAGTGRYCVPLAKEGCDVTAVELFAHNLDILRGKLDGTEPIRALQGNATDLSFLGDDRFDLTLLLGPMYHLYTVKEKEKALSEAVRVTKPGGYILVAYCMNEPTVLQFVFGRNMLEEVSEHGMLTADWHCISEPKDLFSMVRTEEIEALDRTVPVKRVKLLATDGATRYMKELVNGMDEKTFEKWCEYHLAVCERQDLLGASNHTLDILQKL